MLDLFSLVLGLSTDARAIENGALVGGFFCFHRFWVGGMISIGTLTWRAFLSFFAFIFGDFLGYLLLIVFWSLAGYAICGFNECYLVGDRTGTLVILGGDLN